MSKESSQSWWTLWFQVFTDLFRWVGVLGRELQTTRGRYVVVSVPLLWLLVFFLLPLLLVLKMSFATAISGVPPYSDLLQWHSDGVMVLQLSFKNYARLLADPLYVKSYVNSLYFATFSTLACILIGYPMAYGIARAQPQQRFFLLTLVILPFWTSSLLRTYAMIGILRTNGVLNQLLQTLGIIDQPLVIMHTEWAVYIGITYNYLPFMILPLVANLMRLDFTLLQAAADLGARPWRAFLNVTLPLSLPGIIAGSMLVFIPSVGEYVIPDLLGGPQALTVGRRIWEDFFNVRDYPLAAAVAVAMLVLIVVPMILFEFFQNRQVQRNT